MVDSLTWRVAEFRVVVGVAFLCKQNKTKQRVCQREDLSEVVHGASQADRGCKQNKTKQREDLRELVVLDAW